MGWAKFVWLNPKSFLFLGSLQFGAYYKLVESKKKL